MMQRWCGRAGLCRPALWCAQSVLLLGLVLVASQCQGGGGLSYTGGSPFGSDTSDTNFGGGGSGGGGDTDGGGSGGGTVPPPTEPGEIGIDSYVYLSDEPVVVAGSASARQWPAEQIIFTSTARTDLTPYEGLRVFIATTSGVPDEVRTNAQGLWSYRADRAIGTTIDVTDQYGVPIIYGQPVTLSSTALTPWPSADIQVPTSGLGSPVEVIVEGGES